MATINSTSNSINRNSWSTLISSNSNSNGNGNSIGRLLRRRFLFGFFLLVFFFSCITGNYTALKSITASSSSSCTTVTTTTANTTFSYYDNPYTAEGGSVSQFEQLEFIKLIGKGDVSFGFEVRLKDKDNNNNNNNNKKNNSVTNNSTANNKNSNSISNPNPKRMIAKIATDTDLYYSDLEIDIFRILKRPPTIKNIPELYLTIRSMPNPFAHQKLFLKNTLQLSSSKIETLLLKRRISVMVMDLLGSGDSDSNNDDDSDADTESDKNRSSSVHHRQPSESGTVQEIRRFAQSLLETFAFVHSRNIMHCDLHAYNYYWNGRDVYVFDWNGGFIYNHDVPTLIHYPRTPTHLFPPEAKHNTSAVHTSVYAFDVYTIGRLLKHHIQDCCDITTKSLQMRIQSNTATIEEMMVYDLTRSLLEKDPYKRPDTQQALQHPFFTTTAATTKTTTTTAATATVTATSEILKLRT